MKWEYLVLSARDRNIVEIQKAVTGSAELGWELVAASDGYVYFKRSVDALALRSDDPPRKFTDSSRAS